jgi:hypothetical protein
MAMMLDKVNFVGGVQTGIEELETRTHPVEGLKYFYLRRGIWVLAHRMIRA